MTCYADTAIPQSPPAGKRRTILFPWLRRLGLRSPGRDTGPHGAKCSDGAVPCDKSTEAEEHAFADATDFRDLFQRLEAKQALWGSQKRYTAKELKILINRVRTHNPALRLPLEVIPETGGLRTKVQELLRMRSSGVR